MKEMQRALFRIFFAVEMVICTLFYVFGTHGVQVLQRMRHENELLKHTVQQLHTAVAHLEKEIVLWQTADFYKEKKAREQLQMAYTDDIIYIEK